MQQLESFADVKINYEILFQTKPEKGLIVLRLYLLTKPKSSTNLARPN